MPFQFINVPCELKTDFQSAAVSYNFPYASGQPLRFLLRLGHRDEQRLRSACSWVIFTPGAAAIPCLKPTSRCPHLQQVLGSRFGSPNQQSCQEFYLRLIYQQCSAVEISKRSPPLWCPPSLEVCLPMALGPHFLTALLVLCSSPQMKELVQSPIHLV